jgi:hypothetical protein
MDAPPVAGRALADRAVAFACAERISPVDHRHGNGVDRTKEVAQAFRFWLTDGQDAADAHARRLALCLACQNVTTDTSRSDVLRTAREIHGFLTRS